MTAFFAYVMKAGGDIDQGRGFRTEDEADVFGMEYSAYDELNPEDDPYHWDQYDPLVVLLFELTDLSEVTLSSSKYTRPVAIYQRGEKWVRVRSS